MNVELDLAEMRLLWRAIEAEERRLRLAEQGKRQRWRAGCGHETLRHIMPPAPHPDLARAIKLRSKITSIIAELEMDAMENAE